MATKRIVNVVDDIEQRIIDQVIEPWRYHIRAWLRKPTTEGLHRGQLRVAIRQDVPPNQKRLYEIIKRALVLGGNYGGQVALEEIGQAVQDVVDELREAEDLTVADELDAGEKWATDIQGMTFYLHDTQLLNELRRTGSQITGKVTSSMIDDLHGVLDKHIYRRQQNPRRISNKLDKVFPQTYRNRGRTIARTEVARSQMMVKQQTFLKNGIKRRQWSAVLDNRTRPDHAAAHGQVRKSNEPFLVGGAKMMYPLDPAAPPMQTVNCRCTTLPVVGGNTALKKQPWTGGYTPTSPPADMPRPPAYDWVDTQGRTLQTVPVTVPTRPETDPTLAIRQEDWHDVLPDDAAKRKALVDDATPLGEALTESEADSVISKLAPGEAGKADLDDLTFRMAIADAGERSPMDVYNEMEAIGFDITDANTLALVDESSHTEAFVQQLNAHLNKTYYDDVIEQGLPDISTWLAEGAEEAVERLEKRSMPRVHAAEEAIQEAIEKDLSIEETIDEAFRAMSARSWDDAGKRANAVMDALEENAPEMVQVSDTTNIRKGLQRVFAVSDDELVEAMSQHIYNTETGEAGMAFYPSNSATSSTTRTSMSLSDDALALDDAETATHEILHSAELASHEIRSGETFGSTWRDVRAEAADVLSGDDKFAYDHRPNNFGINYTGRVYSDHADSEVFSTIVHYPVWAQHPSMDMPFSETKRQQTSYVLSILRGEAK